MPLNSDQRKKLEELKAKGDNETLTPEEHELLQRLENEDDGTTQGVEDDFDKAFEEFNKDENADPTDTKTVEEDSEKEEESVDDQKSDDQAADESNSMSIFNDIPAQESDSSQANANEDTTSQVGTLKARLTALEQALEVEKQASATWRGRVEAANNRANEAEAKLKEKENLANSGSDESIPEGEEDEILSEFVTEFPDLQKPILAMIKKEATKIASNMVGDRIGKVESKVDTVTDQIVENDAEKHFAAINEAHPDFEQIRDSGALKTWVAAQSGILRNSLENVVANGSTEEVIEMVDLYKKATGKATSTPNPEKESEKSRKKKLIEAVPAQGSGPAQSRKKIDKNDFDGMWDKLNSPEK
jgi:hypothetical protein